MALELAFEETIEKTMSVYETELLSIYSFVAIAFILAILLGVALFLILWGLDQ